MYEVTFVNPKGWRLTTTVDIKGAFYKKDIPEAERQVNENPTFKSNGPWTYKTHVKLQ